MAGKRAGNTANLWIYDTYLNGSYHPWENLAVYSRFVLSSCRLPFVRLCGKHAPSAPNGREGGIPDCSRIEGTANSASWPMDGGKIL
jgi:hypothetical protein